MKCIVSDRYGSFVAAFVMVCHFSLFRSQLEFSVGSFSVNESANVSYAAFSPHFTMSVVFLSINSRCLSYSTYLVRWVVHTWWNNLRDRSVEIQTLSMLRISSHVLELSRGFLVFVARLKVFFRHLFFGLTSLVSACNLLLKLATPATPCHTYAVTK